MTELLSRRWRALRPARGVATTLFLHADGLWQIGSVPAVPAAAAEPARRWDDLTAWCTRHAGQRARLVLGGSLTHHLLVPPELPLSSADEVTAWARHQCMHFFGSAAEAWPLAAWCLGPQRGASALHGVDLPAVLAAAQAHAVSLSTIQPWWCVAVPALLQRHPTLQDLAQVELWLVERALATRLVLADGRLAALDTRRLDAPRAAALDGLMAEYPRAEAGVRRVFGYGFDDGAAALAVPAEVLGSLQGACPDAAWVMS